MDHDQIERQHERGGDTTTWRERRYARVEPNNGRVRMK